MRFSTYLKRLKGSKSNATLAQEIGKSPTFIGQMLRGDSLPGDDTLDRLAEVLGERDELYLRAGKIPREVKNALDDPRLWKLVRLLAKNPDRDKINRLLELCKNGRSL